MKSWLPGLIMASLLFSAYSRAETVVVGSKAFTEGYVLSEIAAQLLEDAGVKVTRQPGLGGTGIVFEALKSGQIDVYPEYTGTIAETILKNPRIKNLGDLRAALKSRGFTVTDPLGFNNTYAIAMKRSKALELGIKNISDLARHTELLPGFSHEFLKRSDGYESLARAYGFHFSNVRGLEHSLAFEALENRAIDFTDVYSTDAKIAKFDLAILGDDKKFFPEYFAMFIMRGDFPGRFPKAWAALQGLKNRISEDDMRRMNAAVDLEGQSFKEAAHDFTRVTGGKNLPAAEAIDPALSVYTAQHLRLVGFSLLAAVLAGLPLGILAVRFKMLGQLAVTLSSVFQTIPSLALLCFLIPVFGIGIKPALVALFLYGLLPIVLNTFVGLRSVDPRVIEVAKALGLGSWRRLFLIELPLASPAILTGIKTSAIINIGTATLAALIGAGGFGTPIVTGLALNDTRLILQGAVPAAALALIAHGVFEVLNAILIPKGLRKLTRT